MQYRLTGIVVPLCHRDVRRESMRKWIIVHVVCERGGGRVSTETGRGVWEGPGGKAARPSRGVKVILQDVFRSWCVGEW